MICPPEIARILVEIIRRGILDVRSHGWDGDAKSCAAEADHIHNLPGLLIDFSPDRLRYYLDVERASYIREKGPGGADDLAPLWAELEQAVRAWVPVPA